MSTFHYHSEKEFPKDIHTSTLILTYMYYFCAHTKKIYSKKKQILHLLKFFLGNQVILIRKVLWKNIRNSSCIMMGQEKALRIKPMRLFIKVVCIRVCVCVCVCGYRSLYSNVAPQTWKLKRKKWLQHTQHTQFQEPQVLWDQQGFWNQEKLRSKAALHYGHCRDKLFNFLPWFPHS